MTTRSKLGTVGWSEIEKAMTSSTVLHANLEYRDRFISLLAQDLDFHDLDSSYASHNFHSFPAKFPPQLPHKFIVSLTAPGEVVLDPMLGSGTTIVEACITGRHALGFDIDPLALLICRVKVTSLDADEVSKIGAAISTQARRSVKETPDLLQESLQNRVDKKTLEFIDYWFDLSTRIELEALRQEIDKVDNDALRAFFDLAFSSVIITKSGGVSLALDLGHTRPHRAKWVVTLSGEVIMAEEPIEQRVPHLTKTLRSALDEFDKRRQKNLASLMKPNLLRFKADIEMADAKHLPISDNSVDLIVTSPPYASNAIDYMRAHKFSLVWMGYSIDSLGKKRKEYIGGESLSDINLEALPAHTSSVVHEVTALDKKKGTVLHRYYTEMTHALKEMYRVLKPGKAAVVVVGSSIMRNRDTETGTCLAEIGRAIGFDVPLVGVRNLDRDRRMLPVGMNLDLGSQIQQRMHQEYVIGLYKPCL